MDVLIDMGGLTLAELRIQGAVAMMLAGVLLFVNSVLALGYVTLVRETKTISLIANVLEQRE